MNQQVAMDALGEKKVCVRDGNLNVKFQYSILHFFHYEQIYMRRKVGKSFHNMQGFCCGAAKLTRMIDDQKNVGSLISSYEVGVNHSSSFNVHRLIFIKVRENKFIVTSLGKRFVEINNLITLRTEKDFSPFVSPTCEPFLRFSP
jgi:hypothetical protein